MTRARLYADRRVMSLSTAEFAASIAKLGTHLTTTAGHPVFDLAPAGRVTVSFEPVAPKTLGGLLVLPQAIVTLTFEDATDAACDAFVHRFDIAFQRGGG